MQSFHYAHGFVGQDFEQGSLGWGSLGSRAGGDGAMGASSFTSFTSPPLGKEYLTGLLPTPG